MNSFAKKAEDQKKRGKSPVAKPAPSSRKAEAEEDELTI